MICSGRTASVYPTVLLGCMQQVDEVDVEVTRSPVGNARLGMRTLLEQVIPTCIHGCLATCELWSYP